MKLILTFDRAQGEFVVEMWVGGQSRSTLACQDLPFVLKEVRQQLLRMRAIASGKTFETKPPRSGV